MCYEPAHNHTDPEAPGYHTHELDAPAIETFQFPTGMVLGALAAILFVVWALLTTAR